MRCWRLRGGVGGGVCVRFLLVGWNTWTGGREGVVFVIDGGNWAGLILGSRGYLSMKRG